MSRFVASENPGARHAACVLSADLAGEPVGSGLIPLVAGLVGDPDRRVASAAGESLVTIVSRTVEGRADLTANELERAVSAVCEAADGYPVHRMLDAIRAALLVQTPGVRAGSAGSRGAGWLQTADEAVRLAARSVVRTLPGPAGVSRAMELLGSRGFGRGAAERLLACATAAERAALLSGGLVLRRPARTDAAVARFSPAEPVRSAIEAAGTDPAAPIRSRLGLLGWIDSGVLPRGDRDQLLEPMLGDDDDRVRLGAASRCGFPLLADFTLDRAARIAELAVSRSAVRTLRSVSPPREICRAAALLGRSPHPTVRSQAGRMLPQNPWSDRAVVRWRRRFALDPTGTARELRGALERGEPGEAASAAAMAGRLGVADLLMPSLVRVLESGPEPRLAAATATALGWASGDAANEPLRRLMASDDARVRANAVEAASARGRRFGSEAPVGSLLDDAHHRPMSTALLALLRSGRRPADAADRVRDLLLAEEAVRRAAGLWLVERSARELKPVAGRAWPDVASVVAELARRGETERERSRATRAARRMLAVMPSG